MRGEAGAGSRGTSAAAAAAGEGGRTRRAWRAWRSWEVRSHGGRRAGAYLELAVADALVREAGADAAGHTDPLVAARRAAAAAASTDRPGRARHCACPVRGPRASARDV